MSGDHSDDDVAIVGLSDSEVDRDDALDGDDADDAGINEDQVDEERPHTHDDDDSPADVDFICQACGEGDDESRLMLCDGCDGGWHTYCVRPKLTAVPKGEWRCDTCRLQHDKKRQHRKIARPKRAAAANARVIMDSDLEEDDSIPSGSGWDAHGGDEHNNSRSNRNRRKGRWRDGCAIAKSNEEYSESVEPIDVDISDAAEEDLDGPRRGVKRTRGRRKFLSLNADQMVDRQAAVPQRSVRPKRAAAMKSKNKNDDSDFEDEVNGEEDNSEDSMDDATICGTCGLGDDPTHLVLCDQCDRGEHMYCLRPKLLDVPRGQWLCPLCFSKNEKIAAKSVAAQRRIEQGQLAAQKIVQGKKVQLILASRKVGGFTAGGMTGGMTKQTEEDTSIFTPSAFESSIEFLCKFENESFRKSIWVPLWVLAIREKGKVKGHWKRHGASETDCDVPIDPHLAEFLVPEKIVDENEDGDSVLVKWCGLLYDDCTWELRSSFLKRETKFKSADYLPVGSDGSDEGNRTPTPIEGVEDTAVFPEHVPTDGTSDGLNSLPLTPLASGTSENLTTESACDFFDENLADDSNVNHSISGSLCSELLNYRQRVSRAKPLNKPLPCLFNGNGVDFGDFENLLGTSVTTAKSLKAAENAAIATGQTGPAPTGLTLHPYQKEGVRWLINKLIHKQSAILGDQMGLGKTIQTAAFCDAAKHLGVLSGPVLIVAPKSTIPNWTGELKTWCPTLDCVTYTGGAAAREALRKVDFPFPSSKRDSLDNNSMGKQSGYGWRKSGGGSFTDVVLTNYEIAIHDASVFRSVHWGAIVVDEGHRLKNQNSRLMKTLLSLNAPWRCLLTGTPLQNNLEELFALLHFLDPKQFSDPKNLANQFTEQAQRVAGGKDDSGLDRKSGSGSDSDRSDGYSDTSDTSNNNKLSFELKKLHGLLEKHMLRRLKKDVLKGLPKKRKIEVSCPLTPFQREVYADVLARNHLSLNSTINATQRTTLNNTLKELQKVCNHPFLYPAAEQDAFKAARRSGLASKLAKDATKLRKIYREKIARENEMLRLVGGVAGGLGGGPGSFPIGQDSASSPTSPTLPLEPLPATLLRTSSGKMQLLSKLLPELRKKGHRVLLFCQMTRMLDILDDWLRASGVGMERDTSDPTGIRTKRVFARIDGQTPSTTRQRVIDAFNAENSNLFLMLISTRAGGLGLNLATADTVILYDPDFNPFVDEQAQARAHRMGQRKEVCVYQLVTAATVEEKIVDLAKSKRAIERLVVRQGKDVDEDEEVDREDNDISKSKTDGGIKLTDSGSVSRAVELAKVLMHGAKGIMTRAARSQKDEKTLENLERKINARCEFNDSEISKLMDRKNLPEEQEDGGGEGYLGGVGVGRVVSAEGEGDDVDEKNGSHATEETKNPLEDDAVANAQLESLLAERAIRLNAIEEERLGRGKRERRTVFPSNVNVSDGEEKRTKRKGVAVDDGTGTNPGVKNTTRDPDPFITTCFACLDADVDEVAGGDGLDPNDGSNPQTRKPKLLRCEHCTACAHPACAGVDEDDEALDAVLGGFSKVSEPNGFWLCGGTACGRRGKRIEGGRAAAVAAAVESRHTHAMLFGGQRKGKRVEGNDVEGNDATNNTNASDDGSSSDSDDRNNSDSDEFYKDSDEESESEEDDGFVSTEGRKERRKQRRLSENGNGKGKYPYSVKALSAAEEVERRVSLVHAFNSQLSWLKLGAKAHDALPVHVSTTVTLAEIRKEQHSVVAKCIAAHVEFENVLKLAATFTSRLSKQKTDPFPVDFLLVLRHAIKLDDAIATACDAVWIPDAQKKLTVTQKEHQATLERLRKCETAVRMTSDPERLRKIALGKNWTEEETVTARNNVVKLLAMARARQVNASDNNTSAIHTYNTLHNWVRHLPCSGIGALETAFWKLLTHGFGRNVSQSAVSRAIRVCVEQHQGIRRRVQWRDMGMHDQDRSTKGGPNTTEQLEGYTDDAARTLFHQILSKAVSETNNSSGATDERLLENVPDVAEALTFIFQGDDVEKNDEEKKDDDETTPVEKPEPVAPWTFLSNSRWYPYQQARPASVAVSQMAMVDQLRANGGALLGPNPQVHLAHPGSTPQSASRSYLPWDVIEEQALRDAVNRHGAGNWEKMRADADFQVLAGKIGVQLKDKWRNLGKHVDDPQATTSGAAPQPVPTTFDATPHMNVPIVPFGGAENPNAYNPGVPFQQAYGYAHVSNQTHGGSGVAVKQEPWGGQGRWFHNQPGTTHQPVYVSQMPMQQQQYQPMKQQPVQQQQWSTPHAVHPGSVPGFGSFAPSAHGHGGYAHTQNQHVIAPRNTTQPAPYVHVPVPKAPRPNGALEWSSEEDTILWNAQKRLGNAWVEIAKLLDGRTHQVASRRHGKLVQRKKEEGEIQNALRRDTEVTEAQHGVPADAAHTDPVPTRREHLHTGEYNVPWKPLIDAFLPINRSTAVNAARAHCTRVSRDLQRAARHNLELAARKVTVDGLDSGWTLTSLWNRGGSIESHLRVDIAGELHKACVVLATVVLDSTGELKDKTRAEQVAVLYNKPEIERFVEGLRREIATAADQPSTNSEPIPDVSNTPVTDTEIPHQIQFEPIVLDEPVPAPSSLPQQTEPAQFSFRGKAKASGGTHNAATETGNPPNDMPVISGYTWNPGNSKPREETVTENAEPANATGTAPPVSQGPPTVLASIDLTLEDDESPQKTAVQPRQTEENVEPMPMTRTEEPVEPVEQTNHVPEHASTPLPPPTNVEVATDEIRNKCPDILLSMTHLRLADLDLPDFERSLLKPLPCAFVYAVVGPLERLSELCETYPESQPVRFVSKMKSVVGRWGFVLEIRAGCVNLSFAHRNKPGKHVRLWFPLEALRALPSISTGAIPPMKQGIHTVKLLDSLPLVKRMCDTLPTESPVLFVKAIGYRVGKRATLLESRGAIVKVRFEPENDGSDSNKEMNEVLRKPFTTWLPVEVVAVVTGWE